VVQFEGMNKKSKTIDEKYLIALYQEAVLREPNDPEEAEIDPYLIGTKLNIATRGVNALAHQLVRGNFAKKRGDLLCIMPTGIKIALRLLSEEE
jgi:hypothetical protein